MANGSSRGIKSQSTAKGFTQQAAKFLYETPALRFQTNKHTGTSAAERARGEGTALESAGVEGGTPDRFPVLALARCSTHLAGTGSFDF